MQEVEELNNNNIIYNNVCIYFFNFVILLLNLISVWEKYWGNLKQK
jgi:hypothetical protein